MYPAALLCPVVWPLLYCMPAVCRLPNGRERKERWEIGESSDPLLRKSAPQITAISRARKDSGAVVTRSADTSQGFCYFPPSRRWQPRHLVVAHGIAIPPPLLPLPRVLPLGPPRSLQSRHVALVLPSGTPSLLALLLEYGPKARRCPSPDPCPTPALADFSAPLLQGSWNARSASSEPP